MVWITLDALAMLVSALCLIYSVKLYRIAATTPFSFLVAASAYAVAIRSLILVDDFTGLTVPSTALALGFWVLLLVGIVMIYRMMKKYFRGGRHE